MLITSYSAGVGKSTVAWNPARVAAPASCSLCPPLRHKEQLAGRHEPVVIDTAPIGVVADAYPLLRETDGVIAVARMEKTTRDSAEHLREQLDRVEAPLLGIVANAVKRGRGRKKYGYGYYGGYYGDRPEADEVPTGKVAPGPEG